MALVDCPECKSQVSDKAASCPRCGVGLEGTCPDCCAVRIAGSSSCSECGYPFQKAGLQEAPARPASQAEAVHNFGATAASEPIPEKLLAAAIGPHNTSYYLDVFRKFQTGLGYASWNWPAFFIPVLWMIYRKMYGFALLTWLGLPIALVLSAGVLEMMTGDEDFAIGMAYLFFFGIRFVVIPMYANRLYFRHISRRHMALKRQTTSPQEERVELEIAGGTNGSALAAVIVVAVVIFGGILAGISIPAYQDYTTRAQVSEGLSLSAGAKAAVTEHFQDRGYLPADNYQAGISQPKKIYGLYVDQVQVYNGQVIVTYGRNASSGIDGSRLVVAPNVNGRYVNWTCYSPDIPGKWLPSSCRRF